MVVVQGMARGRSDSQCVRTIMVVEMMLLDEMIGLGLGERGGCCGGGGRGGRILERDHLALFFLANASCCRLGLMAYERAEAVPMMRGDLMGFELSRYVRSSDCMAVRD